MIKCFRTEMRFIALILVGVWIVGIFGCAVPSVENQNINFLVINQDFIEENEYNLRFKMPAHLEVHSVTIHNTAEPFSARQERDRVDFRRDDKSVSFHFAVDENEALQLMPLNIHAWHAGDGGKGAGNLHSIAVEICRSQCYGSQEELYRRSEDNAAKLAAYLLDSYKLPMSQLKFHQDWSGKFCPHRILAENRRMEFTEKVRQYRNKVKLGQLKVPKKSPSAVWIDQRGGKMFYASSYGFEAESLTALIADFQRRKIVAADFSCWIKQSREQNLQIIRQLEQAGLKVRSFYAYPEQITSEYKRVDFMQESSNGK